MGLFQYPSRNLTKFNTLADEKNVVKCEKQNQRRVFKSFSVFKRTFYLCVQMSAHHKPNDANLCKIARCKWFSVGNMSIPSNQRSLHNMEFISYILRVIEIA